MKKSLFIMTAAGLLILAAAGGYYFAIHQSLELGPTAKVSVAESPPKGPLYPVPSSDSSSGNVRVTDAEATDSTGPLATALSGLIGKNTFDSWILPGDFVRNIVVTVDNLSGPRLPAQYVPIRIPEGEFKVQESGERFVMSSDNFSRYGVLVQLAESLDLAETTKIYVRFYPLFQKAYQDLGQNKYFNDRLVQIIDDLLTTPIPEAPVQLSRLTVTYGFTDPQLEGLSIGKKIMLRLGAENEKRFKAFLQKLRARLVSLQPGL